MGCSVCSLRQLLLCPWQVTMTLQGCRVGPCRGWHRGRCPLPDTGTGCPIPHPSSAPSCGSAQHLGSHPGIHPLLRGAHQCQLCVTVTAPKCLGSASSASCLAWTICIWELWGQGCTAASISICPLPPELEKPGAHTKLGSKSFIFSAEIKSGAQTWLRYSQELLEWQMQQNSWIK